MSLRRRQLGRSGLKVAPFVLGGNAFGWTASEEASFRVLDAFVDAGFNLIDTADVYSNWVPGHSGGESEAILGRWMRQGGRRGDVLIATKVGMETSEGAKGLSNSHIGRSLEGSLRRLQTDHVDLYQAHVDDPSAPLEETLEAFRTLLEEGRVRALGASNYSAARLQEALDISARRGWPRFECLQPRYNLMDRAEFESGVEEFCRREELGVITYSSLASGFLSGKYRSTADLNKSLRGNRIASRLGPRGTRVLEALDQVSAAVGARPATVAIAWLLSRPAVTAPIASATTPQQLSELLAAVDLHLDRASLETLDRASA